MLKIDLTIIWKNFTYHLF